MSPNVNQSQPGTGTTGYVLKSTATRMSPNVNQSQPGTSTTGYALKSTATHMSPNVNQSQPGTSTTGFVPKPTATCKSPNVNQPQPGQQPQPDPFATPSFWSLLSCTSSDFAALKKRVALVEAQTPETNVGTDELCHDNTLIMVSTADDKYYTFK